MKKIEAYICELCREQYVSEACALACEQSHRRIKTVYDKRRKPFYDVEGYPMMLEVEMDNGKRLRYKLYDVDAARRG